MSDLHEKVRKLKALAQSERELGNKQTADNALKVALRLEDKIRHAPKKRKSPGNPAPVSYVVEDYEVDIDPYDIIDEVFGSGQSDAKSMFSKLFEREGQFRNHASIQPGMLHERASAHMDNSKLRKTNTRVVTQDGSSLMARSIGAVRQAFGGQIVDTPNPGVTHYRRRVDEARDHYTPKSHSTSEHEPLRDIRNRETKHQKLKDPSHKYADVLTYLDEKGLNASFALSALKSVVEPAPKTEGEADPSPEEVVTEVTKLEMRLARMKDTSEKSRRLGFNEGLDEAVRILKESAGDSMEAQIAFLLDCKKSR